MILDVGHGNAAVLRDGKDYYVVDGATGSSVVDFLRARGVTSVTAVIVSHSDDDHMAGVTTLLLDPDIKVATIYVNSDGHQETKAFKTFRRAMRQARQVEQMKAGPAQTDVPGALNLSNGAIEILAPEPEDTVSGPQTEDLEGRPITRNGSSVVVRVTWGGCGVALLSGDLDVHGLARLKESGRELNAPLLVFPHHGGGTTGGQVADFAADLMAEADPESVVFSLGRRRFKNPRPEIIASVLAARPNVRILCTQLSVWCAVSPAAQAHEFQMATPGAGAGLGEACAGTIVVDLTNGSQLTPDVGLHRAFIDASTVSPLCLRSSPD